MSSKKSTLNRVGNWPGVLLQQGLWPKGSSKWEYLASIVKKYDHYCLALTILGLWCFIYREYFLFDRLFVFEMTAEDTLTQFYPIEYYKLESVKNYLVSFWSFNFGLGTNIYPELARTSPFELIYLLFKSSGHVDAIPLVICAKFLSAALLFQAFLKKLNFTPATCFIGPILYVFSGYMVLNSHWYHYLDYAVFLALFLYFFEIWYRQGYWLPVVILVGLVPLKREIQILQIVFFGLFYAAYRYTNDFGCNRKIFGLYFRLALLFIFGLLLGALFYFPDISTHLASSRVHSSIQRVSLFGEISHLVGFNEFLNILFRALSPDMLHPWLLYHGGRNYFEESSFYVGLLPFLLFISSLFLKNKKTPLLWIFPLVFSVVAFSPFFTHMLNAFVSGSLKYVALYLGVFILFPFLVIFDSLKNEENIYMVHKYFSIFSLILFLFFIFIAFFHGDFYARIYKKVFYYSIFFISTYAICLYIWSKKIFHAKWILFSVLIVEAVLFSRLTVRTAPAAMQPFFYARGEKYFNNETLSALNWIAERDTNFYRVEKGYQDLFLNDALVQNYFGTEAYLGFASSGVRDFYYHFELSQNSPNLNSYRYGLEKRKSLQNLLGIQYFLCRNEKECAGLEGFSLAGTAGSVRIYKNNHAYPFGRMFYQQIDPQSFQNLALDERLDLISNTVVSPELMPRLSRYGEGSQTTLAAQGQGNIFHVTSWNQQYFSGSITLKQPGILFFPIPFDRGWRVQVNGAVAPLLQLDYGFSGVFLSSAGEQRVVLRYTPPGMVPGLAVSGISLLVAICLRRRFPRFCPV